MDRTRLVRCFALLLASLVLAAVPAPEAAASRSEKDVCERLADIFFVVASYEERGESKADQIVWVRKKFGGAGTPAHLRLLDRAVEYVYATDASPKSIRRRARKACRVNERGQAVLRLPE